MEVDFTLDNILRGDDINALFDTTSPDENIQDKQDDSPENESQESIITENLTPEEMFGSESVGSEENDMQQDASSSQDDGSSPYIYSSIAKALQEEAILTAVDDEYIKNISTPEAFRDAIDKEVTSRLDERQQRIENALNDGVEPSEIQKHENVIAYLDSLTEDAISEESDNAVNLRKQLIFQDALNRGYSKERAERLVTRSIENNTDIEDAKDALDSNKEYFKSEYNKLLKEARKANEDARKNAERRDAALKKSILEDKELLVGVGTIDKGVRQKIYDNISKPMYRDADSGKMLTAVQKYYQDNPDDFLKKVGILYTLTDGFKSVESLVKGKVQKEVKKGLNELEHVLANTPRYSDGNVRMVGSNTDKDSYFGKGWDLDIQ